MMKNRIKRRICCGIVIFNFFLLLGFTGSCEIGAMTLKSYIIKCIMVGIASIIPIYKSGLFTRECTR